MSATLVVEIQGGGLHVRVNLDPDRYTAAQWEALTGGLGALLASVAAGAKRLPPPPDGAIQAEPPSP